MNMAVKTLLIGLGGTGCRVVARVKKIIGTSDPNVQFIGFDTDGSGEGCEGLALIYTSREMTVKEYLNDVQNWQEWFPDNAMLMSRNMIKGAGQVRALSRLALTETIHSGRLGKLEQAIRELQISRGNVEPSNFRIMIVSSFAGGTGSGMFIQTALFLRDYIRRTYGGEVVVRGLFAMPDLFMDVNPSPGQKESMYANAYAALKELNAINEVCLSNDPSADEINMKIDGLFDSKSDRLKPEKKPFDFIFFVDNINARGMVLQSKEDYMNLITTAAYMQVYSPLTDTNDSREDNAILTVIAGNGKPLYGSVGASKIVYPYHDIVEYCAVRATVDSINDRWIVIDKEYAKANAENKKLIRFDPTVKEIDRGTHFIATLDGFLQSGRSLFNFVMKSITETTEEGSTVDRTDTYYEYVYSFVLDKISKDNEIRIKENEAGVTEKQLRANFAVNISKCESALKDYLEMISDRITLFRSSAVQSVIPDDLNSAVNIDRDWNILRLLTVGGHIVHPLAARMLLYKIRVKVADEYNRSSADSVALIKKINDYFKKAYDLPDTEAIESALDRTKDRGIFAKSRFIDEYLLKSSQQKSRLDKYRDNKMIAVVFSDLLRRIDAMIAQYERLFDSLDTIKNELQNRADALETKKHANTAESVTYVCASPEEKRELYESLNYSSPDSGENNVYKEIFYALYKTASDTLNPQRGNAAMKISEKEKLRLGNEKMSEIFHKSVVANNIADVAKKNADKLDLDIYEAMKKTTGGNEENIPVFIEKAYQKALPYLKHTHTEKTGSLFEQPDNNEDSAYVLTFWGVHPDVKDRILSERTLNDIREFFREKGNGVIPEVVDSSEYVKYELSCYQALYCVRLTEIPKFAETGDSFGVFYENYNSRIKKMLNRETVALTPHLDIRWHQRGFLPMISIRKNTEDDLRAARGIWLALIYGGIREETRDGEKFVYASFAVPAADRRVIAAQIYKDRDILFGNEPVKLKDVYELYKAIQFDEISAERFIEVFTKLFESDKTTGRETMEFTGPRAKKFASKLIAAGDADRNALNILACFADDSRASVYEKGIFVTALKELIDDFCAPLSKKRGADFRKLIFESSRFTAGNRMKTDRCIDLEYWEGTEISVR